MSSNAKEFNHVTMARKAGLRAGVYGLLAGVMGSIPDKRLVSMIKSDDIIDLFKRVGNNQMQDYRESVDLIRAYGTEIEDRSADEVLQELAVDRTRIVRGTGPRELKPPYEGAYRTNGKSGESILQLKTFYRAAGLHPDDTMNESPDFLGMELDFMRQMCMKEKALRDKHEGSLRVLKIEEQFLRNHLGFWVAEYCHTAGRYAKTGFYRGFLKLMEIFLAADKAFIENTLSDSRS
jgi:TorA maturation chaperone TorD